jgi:biotin transporter BioY
MAASRIARLVYRWLAWLFVACVVVQFFLAGLGVFAGAANFELHRNWGYTFGYVLFFMIAAALVGRMPRAAWAAPIGVIVLFALQSVFVALRTGAPAIAALHVVNAVAIFTASLWIARSSAAWQRARAPEPTSSPASDQAASEAS